MKICRVVTWMACVAVTSALAPAQAFESALARTRFVGATATLPMRITHPVSGQSVRSVRIDFTTGSPSRPAFSILIDHDAQVLKVERNGQIASPYMPISEGHRVLSPVYTSSEVIISEYTLSRLGNFYSLDLKVTRPPMGDAAFNVSMVASDGRTGSLPGVQSAVAKWRMTESVCEPTEQQIANRTSKETLLIPPQPMLPEPGRTYCDPTFGTEVLRVSDNVNSENIISPLGQFGFNKTATRFGLFSSGGQLRVHTIDPQALASSPGRNIEPIVRNGTTLYINSAAIFWSGSNEPDAADTIVFASGMALYKANVARPVNNQYQASMIADLSSLLDGTQPSNPKKYGIPSLQRCSASRDTYVIGCSILVRTPDEKYPRIGYAVVQLTSHSTNSPATSWQTKAKWINGIDSDGVSNFQAVTVQGSDTKSYTYTLTSPYEAGLDERGGYKLQVDKSGRFVLFTTWDTQGISARYNTMAVLDLRNAEAGEPAFRFLQAGGHGDTGLGVFVGLTTANGSCPSCMKRWDLQTLNSDPVTTENNGRPLTDPLGYSFARQYNSAHAIGSQTAVLLACPVAGCPDLPDPYAGELFNLDTANGLAQTTRLVRVNHTFFSSDFVELQPVQSLDGKFVAYTSNYGENGRKHVFIVRVPNPE